MTTIREGITIRTLAYKHPVQEEGPQGTRRNNIDNSKKHKGADATSGSLHKPLGQQQTSTIQKGYQQEYNNITANNNKLFRKYITFKA